MELELFNNINIEQLKTFLEKCSSLSCYSLVLYSYPSLDLICHTINTSKYKQYFKECIKIPDKCISEYRESIININGNNQINFNICSLGLNFASFPIIIGNHKVGYVCAGHFILDSINKNGNGIEYNKHGISHEEYTKFISSLPVVKKEAVEATLYCMSGLISNLIEAHKINKSLNEEIEYRKELENKLKEERLNLEYKIQNKTKKLQDSLEKLEETNLFLREANNHKLRFLSSVSHELRTPLNGILGFSQLLEKQISGDLNESQLEYVKLIAENGEHLLRLINNILDVTRLDTEKVELELSNFLIKDVIEEVIRINDTKINDKYLTVSKVFLSQSEDLTINADKNKLKKILYHLLSNAIKFTPQYKTITIKTEKQSESIIKLSVIDTGSGIDKAKIDGIFTDFYRYEDNPLKPSTGLGIGLALTKRLVGLHKGEIGLETGQEEGTTFWFAIPVKQTDIN
ncbi:MAG: ATP-binding protein [Cyanobacteriota bacterium]